MRPNSKHQQCGIYAIRNLVTNKLYIGKSKNIYKRIHQHIYSLKNNTKNENPYLQNSFNKYGIDFFEYFVLEFFDLPINEVLVAERELYWINLFNTLKEGYNLRSDSDSRMIVHKKTSEKISNRLKKEWANGTRYQHSEKLKQSWKNSPQRVLQQSNLFSKLKTKYYYKIDNEIIDYKELEKRNLQNCLATFHRKRSNIILFKGFQVERVKIEDIVRHS
jgi:group I intron endonuclease